MPGEGRALAPCVVARPAELWTIPFLSVAPAVRLGSGGDGHLATTPPFRPELPGPRERAAGVLTCDLDLVRVRKDPNHTSPLRFAILRSGCTD